MQKKFDTIQSLLSNTKSDKEVYQEIISFGEKCTHFPKEAMIKENLIQGCQSRLYLTHEFKSGKIKFFIHSDALISKGLAAILTFIYSNETPETLFTSPPVIFKTIESLKNISLNRQLGISNLFKQMQLIASKFV